MSDPTFGGQYLFVCIIKSTYQVDMYVTKTWDLRAKTVLRQVILYLGPRQKWVDLPPTFFELFINFLVVCHLLLNIQKKLLSRFSVSAKYGLFLLWTWSKIENFEIFHKTKNDYFIKINDSCFTVKVKIFDFWPCLKTKWVISCRNGKTGRQFFLIIQ